MSTLTKSKNAARQDAVLGAGGAMLFIGLWWSVTSGFEIINPKFLPDPAVTWKAMVHLLNTGPAFGQGGGYGGVNLLGHILTSAFRVALGFSLVVVIALPLGFAMAAIPVVNRALTPIVNLFRPIPPIAWAPLTILWLGTGMSAVLFAIVIGVIWPLIISTMAGVAATSPVMVRAARALGATQIQVYTRVIIPASMPYLFTGLRLAFGMAWWMIIPAELIAAEKGLGFLIARAQDNNNTAEVIVGILSIAVVGYIFDWLFRRLQRWRYFSTGAKA